MSLSRPVRAPSAADSGTLDIDLGERTRKKKTDIWSFDASHLPAGNGLLAGADEAGRGSLAGPLVAAAVILGPDCRPHGLNDSKKLKAETRQSLYDEIVLTALAVSVCAVPAAEIDEGGLQPANIGALTRALLGLAVQPDVILVDWFKLPSLPQGIGLVKGDSRSAAIAAASIVAKVSRDRMMKLLEEQHPGYGFTEHFGYSTESHVAALRRIGPCRLHRHTFAGVLE